MSRDTKTLTTPDTQRHRRVHAESVDKNQNHQREGQPNATVGLIRKSEAIDLYRKGHTLQEIGEQAQVSRERIRQVLAKASVTERSPEGQRVREAIHHRRKQVIAEQRQAHVALRATKRAHQQRLYEEEAAQWSELWRAGLTRVEMSEKFSLSKVAVGNKINHFRKNLSEALFPRRRMASPPAPRHLRHLWAAGMTIGDIAQKSKVTFHQASHWIDQGRQHHGIEAFPYRTQYADLYSRQPTESDGEYTKRLKKILRPLRRGWSSGKMSLRELAASVNIPTHRIYPLVVAARLRFGWFPKWERRKRDQLLRRQLRAEFGKANDLWKAGMSGPDIANEIGMSLGQFYDHVDRSRRVMGTAWFARRVPTKADRQEMTLFISALWKSGLSTQAIANKVGMQRTSVNCKIFEHRRTYGDECFPRRRKVAIGSRCAATV